MDKILANKFLGLKVEDILKCVLLVGVGYCIAVMLGNFNCVEGLYQCTTGVNTCSTDEYEAGACPGWQRQDGFNRDRPFISNFDEVLSCPDDDSSVDKGYPTQRDCLGKLSELRAQYNTDQPFVSRIDACPNPTPTVPATPVTPGTQPTVWACQTIYGTNARDCYEHAVDSENLPDGPNFPTEEACSANCSSPPKPPAPPPPPPPPPTPASPCTYTGDSRFNEKSTPKFQILNPTWWGTADIKNISCSMEIENCRSDMMNWHSEHGGDYSGFCLQTLNDKDGKGRGSCGREGYIKEDGTPGFMANTGTIGENPEEAENMCKDPVTNNNAGNFAWVADSATEGVYGCLPGCPEATRV